MNINKKVLGIPIVLILIAGLASAAVIGTALVMNVYGIGTYLDSVTNPPPVKPLGFTVNDGDPNDQILQTQSGNTLSFTFPVWKNANGIEYKKALEAIPDPSGSGGYFILSNVQYSGNGIIAFDAEMTSDYIPYGYIYPVLKAPGGNSFASQVLTAGQPCYLSFRISTDDTASIGDQVTLSFDLSLQ